MRRTYRQKPLIVVEYAHISMRLHADKVLFDDAALVVHDIISITGYTQACIVAHSFGTLVASRLCKLHPEVSGMISASLNRRTTFESHTCIHTHMYFLV